MSARHRITAAASERVNESARRILEDEEEQLLRRSRYAGWDPGEPSGERTVEALAHVEDDGLVWMNEASFVWYCSRCGRAWTQIQVCQARSLSVIGIETRRVPVEAATPRRWPPRGGRSADAPDHARKLAGPAAFLPEYRPR